MIPVKFSIEKVDLPKNSKDDTIITEQFKYDMNNINFEFEEREIASLLFESQFLRNEVSEIKDILSSLTSKIDKLKEFDRACEELVSRIYNEINAQKAKENSSLSQEVSTESISSYHKSEESLKSMKINPYKSFEDITSKLNNIVIKCEEEKEID